MNWENPNHRRVASAWLVLAGVPGFVFCAVSHVCMAGHMKHSPYPVWHYALDALWLGCFLGGAFVGRKSNLVLRRFLCGLLPTLCVVRLAWGSMGGLLLLLELPLSFVAAVAALRSLRRPGFDESTHAEVERVQHRKNVQRRLKFTLVGLLATVLAVCAGWFAWQLVRVSRVPRVTLTESSLPFTYELPAGRDASVWLTLPNGKRVAVWWEYWAGFPDFGERPYHEPRRIWTGQERGFRSSDRVRSYMQIGLDSERSTSAGRDEFSLFVNDYCVAWPLAGQTNSDGRRLLTVRRAQERELDYLRKKYGKWPLFD
jgi:hypothetical protein